MKLIELEDNSELYMYKQPETTLELLRDTTSTENCNKEVGKTSKDYKIHL